MFTCNKNTLLLLALAVILSGSSAANTRRPFRSIKAPRETVENYEVVKPMITYQSDDSEYPSELVIEINAQSENYTLQLTKNDIILSKDFSSIYFDENGKKLLSKSPANCHYQGKVEGHPDWTVTMSTCHGLQGEFGDRKDRDSFFHLEPLEVSNPTLHALYLDSEYETDEGTCGSEGHRIDSDDDFLVHDHTNSSSGRVRRQSGVRFVEWIVVIDDAQFNSNGRDLSAAVERAISIANQVDLLYQPLNIRVTLIDAIVFTSGNRFSSSTDPQTLLTSFTDYVRSDLVDEPFDSVMLITGNNLDGNTVGIAFTGSMCRRSFSTGLTQDGGRSLSSVASTAAHELGHIFNMQHDDGRSCSCPAPTNVRCVMSAVSGFPPPTIFSSCSVEDLSRLNDDSCLFNVPTETVGEPQCGNGLLEGDEVCDCGSPEFCTDPCCNAATCQLVAGAQCSAGECCTSTCQFASPNTVCRAAAGECDVSEFCSGDSGSCPIDDVVIDGTPCASGEGFCFDGQCPTHDDQCAASFGSSMGSSTCYNLNTRGDQFGNCGHTATAFRQCDSSDNLCGQLHCNGGTYRGIFDVTGTILTFTIGGQTCSSFTTQPSADVMSPGLVADGTRCGDGRVCHSQSCEPLSSIVTVSCPVGSNGQVCSGSTNGICTNRGVCSCLSGFTGSTCEPATTDSLPTESLPTESLPADVNECATNNGGCAQTCTNTVGSFVCSCRSGFTLDSDGRRCNDIDECATNNGGCAGTCSNTAGSFSCSCGSGFSLNSNGRTCNDINECAANNGDCDQSCTNTAGSFSCSCVSGFILASDGKTCNDINECAANNGGCSQVCSNTAGSFTCSCNDNFVLNEDGVTCRAATTTTDVGETEVVYSGSTPRIEGTTVTFNLAVGARVRGVTCSVIYQHGGFLYRANTDCSSGSGSLTLQTQSRGFAKSFFTATLDDGTQIQGGDRFFRLGVLGTCSAHLVNEGFQIDETGAFTVEFGLSSPSNVNREQTGYLCSIDNGSFQSCSSPFTFPSSLTAGSHTFTVRPTASGGCSSIFLRSFSFEV